MENPPNIGTNAEQYEKARRYLKEFFIDRRDEERTKEFYADIRSFAGVVGLDAESTVREITNILNEGNQERFVVQASEILKKIIDYTLANTEIVEKMRRERIIQQPGNTRLSELMYYTIDVENGTVLIHVAPKAELRTGGIVRSFRDGIQELVRQVRKDPRIHEIQATSWIVGTNPGILKKAGFTVEGAVDEEVKAKHFSDEERPVAWAHISRDELLGKYKYVQ